MRLLLSLLLVSASGCSTAVRGSPTAGTEAASAQVPAATAASVRPGSALPGALPATFPVMPGASAVALPDDDPGLIGLWQTDQVGSAAYDFYAAALPAAGYPIAGLYPGDQVALIRFSVRDGVIWQVVVHGTEDGRVAIEVRLDRP